jgi:DNA-binding Xre family transcriptional regulator
MRGRTARKPRSRSQPKRRRIAREPQYRSPAYLRLLDQLAEGVSALRSHRGWTQEEAADRASMGLRHFQAVEGQESNVTLTTLARLCEGFGVEIRDLFKP